MVRSVHCSSAHGVLLVICFQIPFSSPLQGSIHVELGCQMESQIEERGFLVSAHKRNMCVMSFTLAQRDAIYCMWRHLLF